MLGVGVGHTLCQIWQVFFCLSEKYLEKLDICKKVDWIIICIGYWNDWVLTSVLWFTMHALELSLWSYSVSTQQHKLFQRGYTVKPLLRSHLLLSSQLSNQSPEITVSKILEVNPSNLHLYMPFLCGHRKLNTLALAFLEKTMINSYSIHIIYI